MKKIISLLTCVMLTIVFAASYAEAGQPEPANAEGCKCDGLYTPISLGQINKEEVTEYSLTENSGLMAYSVPPEWVSRRCNTLYNYLATQNDGKELQGFYNSIFNAMSAFTYDQYAKTTPHTYTINNVSQAGNFMCISLNQFPNIDFEAALSVYNTMVQDNPQFFFTGRVTALFNTPGGRYFAIEIAPEYVNNDYRINEAEIIEQSINEYDLIINKNMSNYSIEKKLHDKLLTDNNYAYDENNEPLDTTYTHSIAGSLNPQYGGGVCESYAKTFKYLLNRYDVPSYYIAGNAGENHAWNCVQMDDGNYYCVDATWDDVLVRDGNGNIQHGIFYKYFNMPNTDFYANRTISEALMEYPQALPQCSDSTYYYSSDPDTIIKNSDGTYIGIAPNVSEEETRVTTTTTTELQTETTTISAVDEQPTESTTGALQVIAKNSVMPVIIKKGNGYKVNLNVDNAVYPAAGSSENGTVISLTVNKACYVAFEAIINASADTLDIYIDDTLVNRLYYSQYIQSSGIRVPVRYGVHKVSFNFNRSSANGNAYIYNVNAVMLGDYNLDNEINLLDAISLMSSDSISAQELCYLDVNGDNAITGDDVELILKRASGIS